MVRKWKRISPKRPDRYIDWGVQNGLFDNSTKAKNWCAVLIQVRSKNRNGQVDKNTLSRNLKGLAAGIEKASGAKIKFDILMNQNEQQILEQKIKLAGENGTIVADPNDPRFEFFVYMKEDIVYLKNGCHNDKIPQFAIRMSGPPIKAVKEVKFDGGQPLIGVEKPANAVAVGIIDDGIGIANTRFLNCSGKSRVKQFWLQEPETFEKDDKQRRVVFGHMFDKRKIDDLLADSSTSGKLNERSFYRSTEQITPQADQPGSLINSQSHGTHVLDIAAGDDAQTVPKEDPRPIFAVQLPRPVSADTSGIFLASYVLQALRQILNWADTTFVVEVNGNLVPDPVPIVINFSYGITAGPKDGTLPIVEEIDRLLKERNDRKINTTLVMPAGNGFDTRTTASMCLHGGEADEIDWIIQPDDRTESFVEIWFTHSQTNGDLPICVEIVPPGGPASPGNVHKDGDIWALKSSGDAIAAIYSDTVATVGQSNRTRSRILLAINRTNMRDQKKRFGKQKHYGVKAAEPGNWKVRVENRTNAEEINVDLFVQRDDTPFGFERRGRQSYFDHKHAHKWNAEEKDYSSFEGTSPLTNLGTLNALGSGEPILAGAADNSQDCLPARYTSSGPTATKVGPYLSAVCEEGRDFPGIYAAGSYSGHLIPLSGTSMATAQVTRAIVDVNFDLSRLDTNICRDVKVVRRLGRQIKWKENYPKRRYL